MTSTFLDLEDDVTVGGEFRPQTKTGTSRYAKTEQYPCAQCAGTGRWSGGVNRDGKGHCFACKGQGFFMTSPAAREKARQARRTSRDNKARDAMSANEASGLLKDLANMEEWNNFAGSLMDQHRGGKAWSEKQIAAAQRMIAKVADASKQAAVKAKANATDGIDITRIREMFEAAYTAGHKKPVYRAEGMVLNRAPDHGRNPGAIYVKTDNVYQGKITGTTFYPSRDAVPETVTGLRIIAEDPMAAAVRYGRKTGTCACCGRKLTNELSVELGIGPICRDKWGL